MIRLTPKPRKFRVVRRGAVTILFGTNPDDLTQPLLAGLDRAGFDTIQVPILDTSAPEKYAALAERAAQYGLLCSGVAICPNLPEEEGAVDPGGDDEAQGRFKAHMGGVFACCQAMQVEGGPAFKLLGPIGEPLGGLATDTSVSGPVWNRVAFCLADVAREAHAANVHLILEWLNRWEQSLLCNSGRGAHMVAGVNQLLSTDGIRISGAFDTHHEHIEGTDPVEDLKQFTGVLGGFHASENTRGIIGTGQVELPEQFQVLKEDGLGHVDDPLDIWLEIFSRSDVGLAAATRVHCTDIEPGQELEASRQSLVNVDAALEVAGFEKNG